MNYNIFLTFSDAAKYADVARNLVNGFGYGSSFIFWPSNIFEIIKSNVFPSPWIGPVMPFSIAALFKIFGVSDFAVMAASFFYFVLTLLFVFLLARKIFNNKLVGFLSTVAVAFNYDLINYAKSGASESPFIFEIIAGVYFISLKKRWADIAAIVTVILMFFTRQQAFIYIAGLILYFLLLRFKTKMAIIYFLGASVVALLFDKFILLPLSGNYFLYSIIRSGNYAGGQYLSGSAVSDALRGGYSIGASIVSIGKKVFYDLYNFYKLMPQIINPYLFTLFIIGLFIPSPKADSIANAPERQAFKVASFFMVVVTFLVTAASIPFFRYIHPVVPLIYIVAAGTLVWIMEQISKNRRFIILASSFLILFFAVGQTLGVIFLDSRFERNTHNVGKPPVYAKLSWILRDNTNKDQVVITNLDTWGSWYGERKTIWFPLEPKQLIDPATGKIPFDAIYLTSYLMDDENYYMGTDWRLIFNNPGDPKKWTCDGCGEISREFILKGIFKVSASEDYERQVANAVLLVRK